MIAREYLEDAYVLIERDLALLAPQLVVLSALFGIVAPGATAPAFSRAVTGWFDRAKGQALGIMAAGAFIGALLFTPLVAYMLASYDVRSGYLTPAALVIVPGVPVILIFMRDRSNEEQPIVEEPIESEADPAPKRLV